VTSGPPLANGIVAQEGDRMEGAHAPRAMCCTAQRSDRADPSRSRPDRGLVVMRSDTLNQRGEVLQTLTAKLMVARRAT